MRMKINYLMFVLFLFPAFLFAQEDQGTYLLDNFEAGFAMYKNGSKSNSVFNYDVVTGKIVFKNGNEVLELADVENIAYIKIKDRTFTHVKGDDYYEKISAGDGDFYVFWKYKIISKGKNAGYGTSSQTSSITDYSLITPSGGLFQLESSEQFEVKNESTYYLYLDGKFKSFSSAKAFAKLFNKDAEKEILAYTDKEKIDFKEVESLQKLVTFASKFMK
jgi:hypothetical protein